MKKLAVIVAMGLVTGQVMAASFQPKVVSDSAKWVLHADLDLLKKTQVGAFVVSQLSAGEAGNKLAALSAVLQFDPRKDLSGITLYGSAKDPQQAVAIFDGTFNTAQLVTLLKANSTYEAVTNGSDTIHSWIDDKKPGARMYGCSHSGKILISQGLPMIKESLAVLSGKHPSIETAKTFVDLPVTEPFFMASSDLSALGGQSDAQMFSQAKAGRLALGEKAGQVVLSVALSTADAETAARLQQVAQGLLAMGQMNQQQEPALAALLQAAQVTVEGSQVRMNVSYAADKVVAVLQEKVKKPTPKQAVAAPAPAPAAP